MCLLRTAEVRVRVSVQGSVEVWLHLQGFAQVCSSLQESN